MNNQECANLVERIIQTWPTGPRGRIWTEALTGLDYDAANASYHELRDNCEIPPSIAQFKRSYRPKPQRYTRIEPTETEPAIPPHVGKQVAWQAYVNECRRTLRTPNRAWFTKCLGTFGE